MDKTKSQKPTIMESSERIIFEMGRETSLNKAIEILEAHVREVAIKFAYNLKDNVLKEDYLTELFDKWIKNQ